MNFYQLIIQDVYGGHLEQFDNVSWYWDRVITMVQLYVFGLASGQYFSLPLVAIFDFESRWGGLGRDEIALDGAIDQ